MSQTPSNQPVLHQEPLTQDYVHGGIIFLEGTRVYPPALREHIVSKAAENAVVVTTSVFDEKDYLRRVAASGGFVPEAVPATVPPVIPAIPAEQENSGAAQQPDSNELPADFPFREILIEQGFTDIDEVLTMEDFTTVNGIGKERAAAINAYIEQFYPES